MWFSIFSLCISLFALGYSIYNCVKTVRWARKEEKRRRSFYANDDDAERKNMRKKEIGAVEGTETLNASDKLTAATATMIIIHTNTLERLKTAVAELKEVLNDFDV